MSEPITAPADRRRRARLLGLLLPGGGQLVHGDVLAAAGVLLGVAFLLLACSLELVVHNRTGYPAPLVLFRELGALKSPLTVVPDAPVALIFALVLHVGAAILAGSERFGGPPCKGDAEA
ncbi:MAG: hypothetical protein RIT45_735 [Pseudomonadota bacterium]